MTPLHIVGTIDRVNRCDGYCDKLVFKRLSLVPEAYYWHNYQSFILSRQLPSTSLCYIHTFFATVKLPKKFLKVLSKFHWKKTGGDIR